MRAEARARFEAGDVDSCGAPAEMRRRSEEELRGGEALDNLHGSAAERTVATVSEWAARCEVAPAAG